jgi:hypothetical protein
MIVIKNGHLQIMYPKKLNKQFYKQGGTMKKLFLVVLVISIFFVLIGCSKNGKSDNYGEEVNMIYRINVKVNVYLWLDDDYYFYTDIAPKIDGDTLIIKNTFRNGLEMPIIKMMTNKKYVSYTVTKQNKDAE